MDSEGASQTSRSTEKHGEDQLGYLPEPPEEPLPSDCCGSGCSPCVMDIYQEELQAWKKLEAMTPKERAEWRNRSLASKTSRRGTVAAISPEEYRVFSVIMVQQVSRDSFVYTFSLPEGSVLGLSIGQHIVLRVMEANGRSLTRQYTPISPLDQKGSFDVLIKLYDGGRMSRYVRQWTVGSDSEWRGPFGNFTYTPNKIAQSIVENEEDNTFVHLVYGCRTQHDILLKTELDRFAQHWNFTVLYVLSQPSEQAVHDTPGSIRYGDKLCFGRIDKDLVTREIPDMEGHIVLICGTRSFDKDMINHLAKGRCRKHTTYFKF